VYKNDAIKVVQEMDAANGRLYFIDSVLTKHAGIIRLSGLNLTNVDMASMFSTRENDDTNIGRRPYADFGFLLIFLYMSFVFA
jgi:hypothetical protein